MINKLKKIHKSKTMILAFFLATLSPILEALPQAKSFLGDNYGLALLTLSAVVAALRFVTTQSLADKP